jgi:protein-disulfide isomerase
MAQLNPRITADVIEANESPEVAQRFNVMGVPKTVINGVQELVGAQPEAQLMAAIRAALRSESDRAAGEQAP